MNVPSAKLRFIIGNTLSKDFNGRLRLVLGIPGSGKTTFALHQVKKPFLFVAPGPTNEAVYGMDYVEDTKEGLAIVRENPRATMGLYVTQGNPDLFNAISTPDRTIILDDISMFTETPELKKALVVWCTGVRWKGLQAWATTQRAKAEVPPKVFTAAKDIYNVGPNVDEGEVAILFERRSVNMDFQAFYQKVNSLVPYHWKRRNVAESVFQIKNLT